MLCPYLAFVDGPCKMSDALQLSWYHSYFKSWLLDSDVNINAIV